MKKKKINKNIIIYQAKSGAIELRGDFSHETIWASQKQIVELFNVDQSVVSRHIKNIFKDEEVDRKSNMQKMHIANSDKPVVFYALDVILAVGYRTNSRVAIEFRKWATKTLRSYIVDGFAINKKQIARNYSKFLDIVDGIKKILPEKSAMDTGDAIELIILFADTWLSLDANDQEALPKGKLTKKKVELTAEMFVSVLGELRTKLIQEKKATDIFGQEKNKGAVEGIIGNVMQSFDGKELYPSAEEKAAHLLYFMIKNHPFTDGNKRSGAFAFVWFLKQAKILNTSKMTPSVLTALAVLVAESNPKDKEKVIALILNLISKN